MAKSIRSKRIRKNKAVLAERYNSRFVETLKASVAGICFAPVVVEKVNDYTSMGDFEDTKTLKSKKAKKHAIMKRKGVHGKRFVSK